MKPIPKVTKYIVDVLCFLYAFLLPTQFGKHFWPEYTYLHGVKIDYLAPFITTFDLACLAFALLSILTYFKSQKDLRLQKLFKLGFPTILLLVFLIINIIFSFLPLVTLYKIAKMSLYFWTSYLIIKNYKSAEKSFFYGLFVGTMLVFVLAFWQFATKSSVGGIWYFLGERTITLSLPGIAKMSHEGKEFLRPYSTFSHPNSMGGFYLVLYFLCEFFTKNLYTTRLKFILAFTKLLSLFLIIISFSKVAIFAFVLISFVKVIRDKSYRECILCFFARIAVFVFLLLFSFLFAGDPYTLDKRFFLITQSLEILKNNLLFGVGFGASLVAQSKLAGAVPGRFTDTLQPAHNIYMLFASEIGIVGVALMSCLIFLKRKMFINWQKLPVAAISAILITGFFDHYWLTLTQNIAILSLLIMTSIEIARSKT